MFHNINRQSIAKLIATLAKVGLYPSSVLVDMPTRGGTYKAADENRITIDLARVDSIPVIVLEVNLESNTLTVRTASDEVKVVGYHDNGGYCCFRESNDPAVEFLTVYHADTQPSVTWNRAGDREQTFLTPEAVRNSMVQARIDSLVKEINELRPVVDVDELVA